MTSPEEVQVAEVRDLGPFTFRWPDQAEEFEFGWEFHVRIDGEPYRIRHGIGGRTVYGRERVHTVTWLDGQPRVEGVEADDYPVTKALLSVLRRPDKKYVRTPADVPSGYDGFDVVDHRREIDAPYSRNCLAVKIAEDDLRSWAHHAWLRSRLRQTAAPSRSATPTRAIPEIPARPTPDQEAVAHALLTHGETLADELAGEPLAFAADPEADALVRNDPFAFLVGVVCDHGIVAERAWAVPYELRQRLGHLDPVRIAVEPVAVKAAFGQQPKLHRFISTVPAWVVSAAQRVVAEYDGDAGRIWSDRPSAAELRDRLRQFAGIEQKKSAMAVELLERYLGVPLADMSGSDVAYDVHLRRVFLRAGITDRDDPHSMVAAARALNPPRPGALDMPAWDIGHRWCRPTDPDCHTCPLLVACARLIERGRSVRGPGS